MLGMKKEVRVARNRKRELRKLEKAIASNQETESIDVIWQEGQEDQVYQWLDCQDGSILSGSREEYLNAGNVIIEISMDEKDQVHRKYISKWSDNAS